MPLPEREIVVQFSGGVETKKDRKGVLPSKMLALENAVFSKAISFVKRNGYEDLGAVVLGSDQPLPKPLAVGRRQHELLAFTGEEVYSRVDGAGAWVRAGDVQSVICDHEPVAKTGSNQTLADTALLAGLALYAWEDSRGGVWYALLDDDSGRALVPPTLVDAGGERPRCHAVGSFLHLYWVRTVANEIHMLRVDPTNPTSVVETLLLVNIDGELPLYDVDTDDAKAVIAWRNTDAQIGVAYIHQQGAIGGAGLGLPVPVTLAELPLFSLGVAIDKTITPDTARQVAVTWAAASKQYQVLDYDLAPVFASRAIFGAEAGGAAGQIGCVFPGTLSSGNFREIWIVSEDKGLSPRVRMFKVDVDPSGSYVDLGTRTQRGLVMGGKPFADSGEAYVITQHDSTLFRTYFCQRVSDGLAVARFLPGLAGGRLAKEHLPSVTSATARVVRFAAIYVTDVESPDGDVFTEKGIRRVSLDFFSPDAFRSAQLGSTLYIAGGLVQAYDGQRVTESGFHVGPDDFDEPNSDAPATTFPGLSEGVYGYVFVYENVLGNGEVERGPTSSVLLVQQGDGGSFVEWQIPTYRWPSKPAARIGVYRSAVNDPSVFSRVSSLDPATANQVNGFVANNPSVETVAFRDEMDDVTLLRQEPLYTNGGIPPNDPIGSARLIAGGKNRLFVVDSSQPNRIYFSQELAGGYAAEFSPDLFIDVDPFGGPINGLIVMDDALVVFKETGVFAVGGNGPAAVPELGEGFSAPKMVTSDVGCVSPDSLGYTTIGVCFQSQKGIDLLRRDFGVQNIGEAVEAFNAQRVVACTLIEDETQIRFLTDAGKTLLYDYEAVGPDGFGQWSTFSNHEGQDAILVDGIYHYLRNDGRVLRETPGVYRDGNTQIRMGMETAWLNLAGHLQGWQFLWWVTVVGEFKSNHKLRVFIAFDYEDGWSGPPIEVDPLEARVTAPYGAGAYGAGPYGGINDTRYQFQIHVGQECEAVRFRFEDVEPTGEFGASFELSELHLTGGVQRSNYGVEDARVY